MTELNKDVTRVTREATHNLKCGIGDERKIVVTLAVGDVIKFREKGRQGEWSLPIDALFRFAVQAKIRHDLREQDKENLYVKSVTKVKRGKLGR